jgi:hypothetical protein
MSRVVFGGAMRPGGLRFKRSTSQAFADERAACVEHYVSNRLRHRAMRLVRRLVRWLMGPRP